MNTTIKIIFTASILLNVLLIASYASFMAKRYYAHPLHAKNINISSETRDIVKQAFKKEHNETRKRLSDTVSRYAVIDDILEEGTFDKALYIKEMQALQNSHHAMKQKKIEVIADIMVSLPPEQRKAVSSQLVRMRKNRKDRDRSPQH